MCVEDLCNKSPDVEDISEINEDIASISTTSDFGLVILHGPL
jgi:hypothetical protein